MSVLNADQTRRAVEVMREYLAAPTNPDGQTPFQRQAGRDVQRGQIIDRQLLPLVQNFMAGRVELAAFKTQIDGINKRHEHWGFKGIKGQMFFNMVVNTADDLTQCDQEIKAAILVPGNEEMAASRIKNFASYVRRIGENHVEAGGSPHAKPKFGSIPFFLSYFWQIQDRNVWPVYYTNSVNTMTDLNLWQPTEDLAADYITYKRIHEELMALFSKESGKLFGLYDVEHVFWFKGGNPFGGSKPLPKVPDGTGRPQLTIRPTTGVTVPLLPESYLPPIVSALDRMALGDPALREAAVASGTSLERAFEKSINAAFTLLGYDTKLLGQGQGRVPDGQALDVDDSYAILWDAKIRTNGYSMGTDDRTIKEYITTQSRDLKRRRGLRNIYYLIVSSSFADDFDDAIRSIKMDTDVNEVCLLEAAALIAMVDAKMRAPLHVSLGPDGLQRLFAVSGVLSAETVIENLVA